MIFRPIAITVKDARAPALHLPIVGQRTCVELAGGHPHHRRQVGGYNGLTTVPLCIRVSRVTTTFGTLSQSPTSHALVGGHGAGVILTST